MSTRRQGSDLEAKLQAILARRDELAALMAEGAGDYAGLGREYAELEPIVAGIERYHALRSEIGDLAGLLADPATAGVIPVAGTLSRNSTTILSAVFFPIPGHFASMVVSPVEIPETRVPGSTRLRRASPVLGPMPETLISRSKKSRSETSMNP